MRQITTPTKSKEIKRMWHLIDAKNQILGRVSVQIAHLLMGKDKPVFVSYLDCGDHVVVVNAGSVELTGDKKKEKQYMNFSGYPGGLKRKSFQKILEEKPERIIYDAVSGMLPQNKLRDSMLRRLHVFTKDKHTFENKIKPENQ